MQSPNHAPEFAAAMDCHDTASSVAKWAGAILDTTDLPTSDKRFLMEARRDDYGARRRGMFEFFDRLVDCAARAPGDVAHLGFESMRARVIRLQPIVSVDLVPFVIAENQWSMRSDVYERWWLHERTDPRLEAMLYGWTGQYAATRRALDAGHASLARR